MGRGNVCVTGEYEGLYYVPFSSYSPEYENELDEIIIDYDLMNEDIKQDLDMFADSFAKKYTSFSKTDGWISNTERAILENSLFQIVLEDSEWAMAVKLIQKEQGYYDRGNIVNLQKRHFENYLKGMKEALFELYTELGVYGGAWTSGTIRREEAA